MALAIQLVVGSIQWNAKIKQRNETTATNKHFIYALMFVYLIIVCHVNETNNETTKTTETNNLTHTRKKIVLFVYRTEIAFGMKIRIMSYTDRKTHTHTHTRERIGFDNSILSAEVIFERV